MADEQAQAEFEEIRKALEGTTEEVARRLLIERLLAAYLPFIRLLAGPMLGPRHRAQFDSEDIRQSIGLRLARGLGDGRLQLNSEPQFRKLLRIMVRNLVLDKQDRLPERPVLSLEPAGAEDSRPGLTPEDPVRASREIQADEARAVLLSEIRKALQPDEYYLFCRHHLEGVEFATLGAELGLSADAARMRLRRAVDRLRDRLGHWENWFES